ncbi:hypothetical protein Ddc_16455 [Ditylenchus destructor]|nr:hypothetical protein Ddc_16455 [Ditylenchus destructor]
MGNSSSSDNSSTALQAQKDMRDMDPFRETGTLSDATYRETTWTDKNGDSYTTTNVDRPGEYYSAPTKQV